MDLGSFGFGAPQVLCGTKGTGTVTVKATINKLRERRRVGGSGKIDDRVARRSDGASSADSFTLDFNVTSQVASVSAMADPAVVDCNGTNSAKVSAAVVNAEGQPIADGQSVEFDVVALGTANPIISKTGGGVATTVVTPMSPTDELRGVTVNIKTIPSNSSAESHDDLGPRRLLGCIGARGGSRPARRPAPPPARARRRRLPRVRSTVRTRVRPACSASTHALSWWPALALAAAAFALAGVRFATKQR